MKYIALIDSGYCGWYYPWPKQAEKEYIQLFGEKRLHKNENCEVSLWMGEWLIKNRDKFTIYGNGKICRWIEDPEPNKVYAYSHSNNYFGWTNHIEDGEIYVRVEKIPDNMLWTVITDENSEWLSLYRQPKENGFIKREWAWEKE